MNLKSQLLGMSGTRFEDGTGLSGRNVSTAQDLAKLVQAAHAYPKIRDYTTSTSYQVKIGRRMMRFGNTNNLTRSSGWSNVRQTSAALPLQGDFASIHARNAWPG